MMQDKDNIHSLHERVAALEAHMQHVATKAWVLGGVLGGIIGGMGVAATITLTIIRILPA